MQEFQILIGLLGTFKDVGFKFKKVLLSLVVGTNNKRRLEKSLS